MKKILVLALALVVASASGAFAAGTATVDVSATVLGTCTVNSNGTLAFNLLDPAAPVNTLGVAVQPTFTCSNGTPYTITDDNGLYEIGTTYRMASGANRLVYSFTYTAAGTGSGAPQNPNIGGQVLAGDIATATPGLYADTVTLTINP